jgi:hypothetical protein
LESAKLVDSELNVTTTTESSWNVWRPNEGDVDMFGPQIEDPFAAQRPRGAAGGGETNDAIKHIQNEFVLINDTTTTATTTASSTTADTSDDLWSVFG